MAAGYKFMGATPDASVITKSCASATTSMLVVILVFTGVDQTTPLAGVTPTTATGANGARPDNPSITTPSSPSGCVMVGFGGQASGLGTALTVPTTTPFDAAARYTGVVSRTSATNNGSLGYGIKTGLGTSTAFDPSVWNGGQSTNPGSNASLSFILAPPATAYNLTADGAALTLTGTAASLLFGRKLAAVSGSLALTGTDAGLLFKRLFAAGSGSFALGGADAGFRVGKTMAATGGSFTLAGTDVGFRTTRIIAADGGAVALTGVDAGLRFGRFMAAGNGAFALSGGDLGFLLDRRLAAGSGDFVLSGANAALVRLLGILAESGSFQAEGDPANLIKDRAFLRNRRRRAKPVDYGMPIYRNIGR
jgi:hypothetical protein